MAQQELDHYNRVATSYDSYGISYHSGVLSSIRKHVPIDPNDVVVDIGGGTGEIAHQLWKHAHLKTPVLCVDPAKDMLVIANTKEGVDRLEYSAEEFFVSRSPSSNKPIDKILMCGCVHHFSDPKAVFTGVKEHLSEKGVCIVLDVIRLSPVFQLLKQNFGTGHVDSWEALFELFGDIGLKFKVLKNVEKYPTPKSEWYSFMRDRFITKLEGLTDEEIEEGILELEKDYGSQDEIEVEREFKAVLVTKE